MIVNFMIVMLKDVYIKNILKHRQIYKVLNYFRCMRFNYCLFYLL